MIKHNCCRCYALQTPVYPGSIGIFSSCGPSLKLRAQNAIWGNENIRKLFNKISELSQLCLGAHFVGRFSCYCYRGFYSKVHVLKILQQTYNRCTLFASSTEVPNGCLIGAFHRCGSPAGGGGLFPVGLNFNAHTAPEGLLKVTFTSCNQHPIRLLVQRWYRI